jgi:hypothetical protein
VLTVVSHCHVVRNVRDYRRGMYLWLDLFTTYTHHSELQAITTLSLIFTLYRSLHAKFSPACNVFTSRSVATASNNGDSSSSRPQVRSSQPPIQSWIRCQLNYNAIFSQPPLQNSTVNWLAQVEVKVMLRPTISRPVYLGIKPHLGLKTRFSLRSDDCGFVDMGRPLWLEVGSVICHS